MTAALTARTLAAALAPLSKADLIALAQQQLQKKAAYAKRGIDYDGLTSQIPLPVIEPARVLFRDAQGQWIEGVSEPKIDPNHFRVWLTVKAYAPCPRHGPQGMACRCRKRLTGMREGPTNLLTNQFAGFVRAGIFGTTTTVTDTTPTARSLTSTLNGGVASANTLICAGTGATAATVADTNMQTQTESIANPTVNTITGTGATGTFTVVGTITATADRAYTEVGIKVQTTTNSWVFLIARDTFATLNVSNTGTLATTYSIQNQ